MKSYTYKTTIRNLKGISSAVILAMLLVACGGNGSGLTASPNEPKVDSNSYTEYPGYRTVSLEEVVPEIQNFPAPEGVDNALFEQLREALLAEVSDAVAKNTLGTETASQDFEVLDNGNGQYLAQWGYLNKGDYDLNGVVNVSDLTVIGLFFGSTTESEDWPQARRADGDNNGIVNASDISPIGQNYNSHIIKYILESSVQEDPEGFFEFLQEVKLTDGHGLPLYFTVPIDNPDDDYFRAVPIDNEGNKLLDSNVIARPGGAGGHFIPGAVIDTLEMVEGQAVIYERNGLNLTFPVGSLSNGQLIEIRRANLSSDVKYQVTGTPISITSTEDIQIENCVINWEFVVPNTNFQKGDADLVVVRKNTKNLNTLDDRYPKEHIGYCWGDISGNRIFGKHTLKSNDIVIAWYESNLDQVKTKSSIGDSRLIPDNSAVDWQQADYHVVFVHGMDVRDRGTIFSQLSGNTPH